MKPNSEATNRDVSVSTSKADDVKPAKVMASIKLK